MLTTDLSLRFDPAYEKISRRFMENPDQFADAFARAWFKLTHRDMGPRVRYLGPLVPKETLIWQDPIPAVDHPLIGEADIAALKAKILASGLSVSELVSTAWASASTFRGSDKRGGANGARIRLAPQKDWDVNQPAQLAKVLEKLEAIQKELRQEGVARRPDRSRRCRRGREGRERCRRRCEGPLHAGTHGRVAGADRRQSFAPLEPRADGFRNYVNGQKLQFMEPVEALVDRAAVAEADGTGDDGAGRRPARARCKRRRFQARRLHHEAWDADERLLRQPARPWTRCGNRSPATEGVYEGRDRKTNAPKWTGTSVDLIFGSHSQLRAFAEVYGCADSKEKFVKDFVAAWNKVMNADRFDLITVSPQQQKMPQGVEAAE